MDYNYKDIWLVRHTETETPESYDFDLSREGRRNAQIIGWYMAQQEMLAPAVMIYTNVRRADTMAENILLGYRTCAVGEILHADPGPISRDPQQGLLDIWGTTLDLDKLAQNLNGQTLGSAIYIVHRQYERIFDLLRVLLATEEFEGIKNLQGDKHNLATARRFMRGYQYGQTAHIRVPCSNWKDLEFGTGKILSDVCPKDIKSNYKDWRRNRYLALQQPS